MSADIGHTRRNLAHTAGEGCQAPGAIQKWYSAIPKQFSIALTYAHSHIHKQTNKPYIYIKGPLAMLTAQYLGYKRYSGYALMYI